MKIASSTVSLASKSVMSQSQTKQMTLQYWAGNRINAVIKRYEGKDSDSVKLSELARKLSAEAPEQQKTQPTIGDGNKAGDVMEDGLYDLDQQKIEIIDAFLYRLTGRHMKFRYIDQHSVEKIKEMRESVRQKAIQMQQAAPIQPSAGFGLTLDYTNSYSERQEMSFSAQGTVMTEDGRTVDFSATLRMSREFQSSAEMHIRAGDALVDPLVINLSGAAPQLTDRDFSFDIDMDGEQEQITRLMAGSGFLALDKNGDGTINNGGELFGPTMGNGFNELKTYDSDGNNWIDENDVIYNKLRIWQADEQGNMQLIGLGQAGVGALYLGNVASAFDVKDTANKTLGSIRTTGVFLRENGGVGTIQHIDLAV